MPTIYLSPSLQEYNPYVDGGNEEYYMNLITDEMIPFLRSSGIQYVRNEPSQRLSQAIAQSNQGNYDLHLAIHSNAAPQSLAGKIQGTDVYYYATSTQGKRAADIIAQNFKEIYPNPSLVKAVPTTTLAELKQTKAPAVLIEVAYHDNVQDAQWIRDNIENIARNLVMSLTEYFGIPFVEPITPQDGTAISNLNIYSKPNLQTNVVATVAQGDHLEVVGKWENWYVVNHGPHVGYAQSNLIRIS